MDPRPAAPRPFASVLMDLPVVQPLGRALPLLLEEGYIYIYINIYILFRVGFFFFLLSLFDFFGLFFSPPPG